MSAARYEVGVLVDEPFAGAVDAARLERIARAVLSAEGVPDAELGVLVTGDETVRRLNRDYAGEDRPTDVLAFSLEEGEAFVAPDGVRRLGEVVISLETAVRQAQEAGKAVDAEVALLLVHGILHLLGYDHATPEDERAMFGRTAELLEAIDEGRAPTG